MHTHEHTDTDSDADKDDSKHTHNSGVAPRAYMRVYVRACAGAAESLHTHTNTPSGRPPTWRTPPATQTQRAYATTTIITASKAALHYCTAYALSGGILQISRLHHCISGYISLYISCYILLYLIIYYVGLTRRGRTPLPSADSPPTEKMLRPRLQLARQLTPQRRRVAHLRESGSL